MTDDDEKLLDAFRTIASVFGAPKAPAHDLILHTETPDPDAVRRAIKKGELPASQVGRCFWIRRPDLEAFLDSHKVVPRPRKQTPANDDALDITREVAASAGMHVKRARSR